MDHAQLVGKSLEELREIALKLKIKPHHKAKAETIIHKILQQPQANVRDSMKHQAETPAIPVHNNTAEMVMDTIKEYSDKEGFSATFPGDGTWIFKCKGAEESGNLSIPLRIIKMKAEMTARGRRALRTMKFDGDTILAG